MVLGAVNPALLLLLLACPVGMGLMMLFMGRNMRMGGGRHRPVDRAEPDTRSLADLKAEQARIAERIDVLEKSGDTRPEPTKAR